MDNALTTWANSRPWDYLWRDTEPFFLRAKLARKTRSSAFLMARGGDFTVAEVTVHRDLVSPDRVNVSLVKDYFPNVDWAAVLLALPPITPDNMEDEFVSFLSTL